MLDDILAQQPKRRFGSESAFQHFLWERIRASGVEVVREFAYPLLNGRAFIDLVIPSSSPDDRMLFAIECKTSLRQSELQRALGQCASYHAIDPGRVSVCLCMPSSLYAANRLGFHEACQAAQIALVDEDSLIDHIHTTKLTPSFGRLPPPRVIEPWAWAGLLRDTFQVMQKV